MRIFVYFESFFFFFSAGCRGCSAEVKNVTDHKEMSGRSRREGSGINFTGSVMKRAVKR